MAGFHGCIGGHLSLTPNSSNSYVPDFRNAPVCSYWRSLFVKVTLFRSKLVDFPSSMPAFCSAPRSILPSSFTVLRSWVSPSQYRAPCVAVSGVYQGVQGERSMGLIGRSRAEGADAGRTLSVTESSNFCLESLGIRNLTQEGTALGAALPFSEAAGVTESGTFSQSDADLSSRGLRIQASMDGLDLDQLNSLFVKVGFPRRQKEKLARALEHTVSMLWIQDTKSEQLLAFARATGDSVFNAIIWDVVVDPSYQGLGFGKVVMERLMADLLKKGISNIALYAEPNVVGFYRPLGFISDPDGIRAMAYSRRRK